jgi:hypothetical protein
MQAAINVLVELVKHRDGKCGGDEKERKEGGKRV